MDSNVNWDDPNSRYRYYADLKRQLCKPGYKKVLEEKHDDGESQLKKLLKEIPKEYWKEALDHLGLPSNYLD